MMTRFYVARRIVPLLLLFVLLVSSLASTVPAHAAPVTQSGVQRIRFAPGATSGVVSGTLGAGQVARYVLTALAGQTMTVQPYSDGAPVFVTIFDTNRAILGSTTSGEQWTGRLPATGDYSLMVFPSPYAGSANFQLRVEITNRPQIPTPVAERIRFETGAVSAQVEGFLPSGSSKVYVLGAQAGQVMSIQSWTNSGPFRYTVTSANGATLGSGSQGEQWSGTLPSTEDYRIILQSPSDAQAAHYGLVVSIVNATPAPTPTPVPPAAAERIRFPRGATSVTLTGYVDSYTPARYVLRALRGQTMTIDLDTLYHNATSATVRDERGNYLGSVYAGGRWSGYLALTGDYTVEVNAPQGNVSDHFSLWIEIR
jgi:hypothetical protein